MRKRTAAPKKLFTIMLLSFIGFNSLLLLISGIVFYGTYSELAYREIRATKEELLDETSQKLSNYVKSIQDTALFLVTNSRVQKYLSEQPHNFFDYVSRNRDLYEEFQKLAAVKDGVYTIELYTDWLVGYPPIQDSFMHTIEEAQEEGWLDRMEKSDGYWLASHGYNGNDSETALQVVSYVHKIFGIKGETLGIVKINIHDQKLFNLLHKPNAATGGGDYYVIMDARGRYIASMPPPGFEKLHDTESIVQQAEGTKYSVIQSDMNPQYWMLMQFISKDVLKQNAQDVRAIIVSLVVALLLLSLPIAYWLTRKLTSPINRIVEGMHTIEKGDFNVRINSSGIQEYLYLTTHFNRMTYRLKDLIGRLNQEHRDRREAEIQLLHAQIKPHFLYNTLDLIHWRALDYNAHEISQMVRELSKLFRIGLGNDKWYVPVRDELMHARCYMTIQEYRQHFAIVYEEQVESELYDAVIPKIVLQPFLENAVIHGFQDKDERAVIKVAIKKVETAGERQLSITIEDNGRGLPDGFDIQHAGGIGIRNVVDRIHLYCGPKYGVSVSSGEHGGTRVVIMLPLICEEAEMEQLTRSLADEYDFAGR